MTDEIKAKSSNRIEAEKLKIRNDESLARIEKLGGTIDMESVERARDEHMLGWIYTNLMTEEQRDEFMLSWQSELAKQLQNVEGQARERSIELSRKRIIRPASPGASGLIVP